MPGSVRDYAILWVGARSGGSSGGTAMGGNALTTTPQHKLDGIEHVVADDTTRLDASVAAHGLMPKLSGEQGDALRGDGSWGPAAGSVPTFIAADEVFIVPVNRQALFAMTIDVEGSLVVDGYLIEVG
jgi:hypothetical protein